MIVTAVFERATRKYGNLGYIMTYTELGAMTQNLYLNSCALGLGACAIGGFSESRLNELIDIDGYFETVIGVIAVGMLQI